ncbi:hypothetical protein [Lusitaniella coriacea]|uniref:hypothetical protein n=1 Tax=Lusitaniella coriacea TaxID=1983105 RepID=UPI003CEABAC1
MKQFAFPLDLPELPRSSLSASTQPALRLMLEMGLNKDAIAEAKRRGWGARRTRR